MKKKTKFSVDLIIAHMTYNKGHYVKKKNIRPLFLNKCNIERVVEYQGMWRAIIGDLRPQ